jgi:hypothetical protein
MQDLDPLLTIAEVSVAFAGFASLVTVVARRDVDSWHEGNLMRFKLMIYMSLASVLFALLPFAFLYFGVAEIQVWRFSGGLVALFLGCYLAVTIPTFIQLAARGELNGYVAWVLTSLGIFTVILQGLGFFYVIEPSIGTYFIGTGYFLFLSAVSFARLVGASIPPAHHSNDS